MLKLCISFFPGLSLPSQFSLIHSPKPVLSLSFSNS